MAKKMTGPDAARAANSARKPAPTKLKVSQATINEIKKMGMKNALATVKMYAGQGQGLGKAGADMRAAGQAYLKGEQAEGVRRLYGDRRFGAATAKPKKKVAPKATSPDSARSAAGKPKYTSPDAARRSR